MSLRDLLRAVAFVMLRWLLERDKSRDKGDKLAREMLDLLRGEAPDFGQALIAYYNADGPAWALPPGEYMITRYDWTRDMTAPVAVFKDKAAAELELERLRAAEIEDRRSGKIVRSQFYALVKRPSQ